MTRSLPWALGIAALSVSGAAAQTVLSVSGAAAQTGTAGASGAASEWTYFGGTRAFTRYAPLDQIDRSNVARLRVAWRRPAVDPSLIRPFPELEPSGYLRATPILVDGVLYASNAVGLVEAFDPGTGETLWLQRPSLPTLEGVAGRGVHGVAYWSDGVHRRIFSFRNRFLHALDAGTGERSIRRPASTTPSRTWCRACTGWRTPPAKRTPRWRTTARTATPRTWTASRS